MSGMVTNMRFLDVHKVKCFCFFKGMKEILVARTLKMQDKIMVSFINSHTLK